MSPTSYLKRAVEHAMRQDLAGSFAPSQEMLAFKVDSVAVMTQRRSHNPIVLQALDGGEVQIAPQAAGSGSCW